MNAIMIPIGWFMRLSANNCFLILLCFIKKLLTTLKEKQKKLRTKIRSFQFCFVSCVCKIVIVREH